MSHSRAKRDMMMKDIKLKSDNWIKKAVNPDNKGSLHKGLGIASGDKISEKKLKKAQHSKSPLMRKRANLAETLRGFNH
jgi:hypothetical protein